MTKKSAYRCPNAQCGQTQLISHPQGLQCLNGHIYPFSVGTQIPVFVKQEQNLNEYSRENAAVVHDNALRWVFDTFGLDEPSLRTSLVSRLPSGKDLKLLVTGVGAGNDLPYLIDRMKGGGEIYAQDIAEEMLLPGAGRHKVADKVELYFSVSDAMALPLADNYFDAAYHFGGINLFANIRQGIQEMNRVVKPGGKVIIGDEGIAPWLINTELGAMLIRNNPLYACKVPLDLLPDTAQSVNLSWELSNCFYVIEFIVGDELPAVNIDVPHLGKRGGSIRTRYFGQLEGIDPKLKDQLYAEAERLGMSRVTYLESLLRSGISGNPKTK